MTTFTITLDNQDQVTVKIHAYERDLIHELEKIVKKNASSVAKQAKINAPLGPTGNLKSSIRTKDVSKLMGISDKLAKTVVARKPKGAHRHWNELGARSTSHPRGKMPAQPFMAPAEKAVAPTFNAEIRARILKKVEI